MSEDFDDPYEAGQRRGDLDWGTWLPSIVQRVVAGMFLVVFALLEANYQLNWGLLGQWAGAARIIVGFSGAVMILRMLPPSVRRRE